MLKTQRDTLPMHRRPLAIHGIEFPAPENRPMGKLTYGLLCALGGALAAFVASGLIIPCIL